MAIDVTVRGFVHGEEVGGKESHNFAGFLRGHAVELIKAFLEHDHVTIKSFDFVGTQTWHSVYASHMGMNLDLVLTSEDDVVVWVINFHSPLLSADGEEVPEEVKSWLIHKMDQWEAANEAVQRRGQKGSDLGKFSIGE